MQDLFSQRGAVGLGTCARRLVALVFTALLMSLGLFSPPAAAAADSIEIRRNLPLLLQTLESLPYSKEGKGPVLYVIEFSTCPYARRFEADYGAKLPGMGFEMRRIYYGVDVATQNNAAASALSRDPAMQRAFMFDNRRAVSVYDSPAALAAYQDVPDKLKSVVAVLQQSGWRSDRVVSPMFIYPDGQRMFADGGYVAEHFQKKILTRLQLAANVGTATATSTPAAAGSTAAAAAPDSRPLPDVLGFRLRMTVPEVLARVKALKLPHPDSGGVVTSSVAGLPNSSHQSFVTAHDVGPNGVFRLSFSAPPEESRLVNVNRGVDYKAAAPDAAPAYATLRAALVQKFGPPTESSGDKKFHERLIWIWDRQGRLLTQSPGTGCTFSMFWESVGPMRPPSANVERQIERGCAVMVQTDINFNGAGVVERLNQAAVDVDGRERAARITQQAIDDHAKRQGDQQLEKSKQQKPAI
jgi:hypothetical protein